MRAQLLCAVSVSRPGVLSSSGPGRRSFRRGQSPRVAGRRTVWTGGLSWVSPERRDLHDQWGQETLCTTDFILRNAKLKVSCNSDSPSMSTHTLAGGLSTDFSVSPFYL